MSVGARVELAGKPARAPTRSVRQGLAGLSHAVLAAAARDGSSVAVAFTLVDTLASASGSLRVSLARAASASDALSLIAMSGQTDLDPRRGMNRRLIERLESTRTSQPNKQGVRRCLKHDGDVDSPARQPDARESIACASLVVDEPDGACIAVAFERRDAQPFSARELELLAATLRDPIALLHRLVNAEAPWYRQLSAYMARSARVRSGGNDRAAMVLRLLAKRSALLCIAALTTLLLCALPVPLVVKARASIEAEDRQIVAAADDGHLLSAHARAGDTVRSGQLLARLDDRNAALEAESWQGEVSRNAEALSRALALRDRAALGELRADAKRIAVELAGADRRVERAQLLAPFDGVILAGDPGRRLGAPVEAGDVLFELASSDRYRLMLEIDERDVRFVHEGLEARVRMSGMPDRVWLATLDALLPVAVAEPGKNVFRMPAALEGDLTTLRPGMQGVARIRVGSSPMLAVLTRGLRERVVLLAWRFGLIS